MAPVGAVIDHSTGTIKVKKGAVQNSRPSGPEELRVRLDLVANAILMCAFRYPNKAAFQRITPNIFSRYANHLLGEHVFGLRAKDDKGRSMAQPRPPSRRSTKGTAGWTLWRRPWWTPGEGALPDHSTRVQQLGGHQEQVKELEEEPGPGARALNKPFERTEQGKPKGKGASGKSKGGNAQEPQHLCRPNPNEGGKDEH